MAVMAGGRCVIVRASSICLEVVPAHLPLASSRAIVQRQVRLAAPTWTRFQSSPSASSSASRQEIEHNSGRKHAHNLAACSAASLQSIAPSSQFDLANADALPVIIVATMLFGASAVWHLIRHREIERSRLNAEELIYLCEGDQNVVCMFPGAPKRGIATAWRGRLIRFAKESSNEGERGIVETRRAVANLLRVAALHRTAVTQRLFHKSCMDCPQIVAIPEADVRAADAQILADRPSETRNRRIAVDATHPHEHPGRVLALRMDNLYEAPVLKGAPSLRGSAVQQTDRGPALVTFELRPGCGFNEIEGLPSRDALRWHDNLAKQGLLSSEPSGVTDASIGLFSGNLARIEEVLRGRLLSPLPAGEPMAVLVNGRPLHPMPLPADASSSKPVSLPEEIQACGLGSCDDLVRATAAVLSVDEFKVLADLARLQQLAAGDSERLAGRLLEDLAVRANMNAIDDLDSTESAQAAITSAAARRRRLAGMEGTTEHVREGRRLVGLPKSGWNAREIAAAKQWLSLFLLGRAAMNAQILISFCRISAPGEAPTPAGQKQMREQRFVPLPELTCKGVGAVSQPDGLWVRITVTGVQPVFAPEVRSCASELDNLARAYRERQQ